MEEQGFFFFFYKSAAMDSVCKPEQVQNKRGYCQNSLKGLKTVNNELDFKKKNLLKTSVTLTCQRHADTVLIIFKTD